KRDECANPVRAHYAQQEDDEHCARALWGDYAGAGRVEVGIGKVWSYGVNGLDAVLAHDLRSVASRLCGFAGRAGGPPLHNSVSCARLEYRRSRTLFITPKISTASLVPKPCPSLISGQLCFPNCTSVENRNTEIPVSSLPLTKISEQLEYPTISTSKIPA